MLRALILGRLSICGHQPTIKIALKKFQEHADNNAEIVPDLRATIYCTAGRSNEAQKIARLQKIFESSGFSEVENHCILAMSQCSDLDLIKSVYEYGIDLKKIRSQDLIRLFWGSTSSKVGQDFVWNYFKDNCQTLLKIFGSANSAMFQRILKFSADQQCSIANEFEV